MFQSGSFGAAKSLHTKILTKSEEFVAVGIRVRLRKRITHAVDLSVDIVARPADRLGRELKRRDPPTVGHNPWKELHSGLRLIHVWVAIAFLQLRRIECQRDFGIRKRLSELADAQTHIHDVIGAHAVHKVVRPDMQTIDALARYDCALLSHNNRRGGELSQFRIRKRPIGRKFADAGRLLVTIRSARPVRCQGT